MYFIRLRNLEAILTLQEDVLMKNVNPVALTITLAEWPAVVTVCFGIAVIGGAVIYLGNKLIDNGYEITFEGGISVTRRDDPPELNDCHHKEAA